jgi:hypothetical protein
VFLQVRGFFSSACGKILTYEALRGVFSALVVVWWLLPSFVCLSAASDGRVGENGIPQAQSHVLSGYLDATTQSGHKRPPPNAKLHTQGL